MERVDHAGPVEARRSVGSPLGKESMTWGDMDRGDTGAETSVAKARAQGLNATRATFFRARDLRRSDDEPPTPVAFRRLRRVAINA